MDCGERIYIESPTHPDTVVAYCCLEKGHGGRHQLAGHLAWAYGVDRWGRLPEKEKAAGGEAGRVEAASSK